MQLVEIEMLRVTAEGLLEVGHERLGLGQVQVAPFIEGVALDIRLLGLTMSIRAARSLFGAS